MGKTRSQTTNPTESDETTRSEPQEDSRVNPKPDIAGPKDYSCEVEKGCKYIGRLIKVNLWPSNDLTDVAACTIHRKDLF